MAKFVWQDGTLVSKAKVEVGGTIYEVDPEEYSGSTPLSASNLNAMVNNIYDDMKVVYSTTETVIGTWLDKPLYRKVVFLNTLPNSGTDVRYSTGITTNINIIRMYGKAYASNINKTFTLPFVGTKFIGWVYDNATNEIMITTTNDRSNLVGYAVLEYTKTND